MERDRSREDAAKAAAALTAKWWRLKSAGAPATADGSIAADDAGAATAARTTSGRNRPATVVVDIGAAIKEIDER